MADPTKNTFQNQASLYLGLDTPTAGSLTTTAQDFVIGYQGTEYSGGTSRGFEFVATQPDLAILDIHANDGATGENFDYRIIWGAGGATGEGQGGMNCQGAEATFYHPLRTNPSGAPLPPAWFIDYGSVVAPTGVNQDATITFNTTFKSAPQVFLQLFDVDGPGTTPVPSGFVYHTYNTTVSGTTVRGLGNLPANFKYSWLAVGGV